MRHSLCALALLSASVCLAQQQAFPVRVVLKDQFDRTQDTAARAGDVVVLVYGDRASTDANRDLGARLHVQFHPTARGLAPKDAHRQPPAPIEGIAADARTPDAHVAAVAVVGKVPGLVQTVIRNQIRRGAPDVPVWLDFEDRMKGTFGLTPGVPNVVVLDAQGRLRFRTSGEIGEPTYARIAGAVEFLRREAAGVK